MEKGKTWLVILFLGLGFALGLSIWKMSPKQLENISMLPINPIDSPVLVTTSTPSAAVSPAQVIQKSPTLWGTYTGWTPKQFKEFEAKVDNNVDLVGLFVHWGNEKDFPEEIGTWAKPLNKTLVIYWEAMDYNKKGAEDTRFSYDAINKGNWDGYIKEFAQAVKKYGGPVIIIPFEEMNGDWYPWSGTKTGNSPVTHIQAFRHIKNLFTGVNNAKFAWVVNNESVPDTADNSIHAFYPGDSYVDYVGVNGFNFGDPWESFDQIFGKPVNELKKYNKPIYIFSMACADGTEKADWIKNALNKMKGYGISGWIWFNENKERDWRVWSDNNSLEAFRKNLPI